MENLRFYKIAAALLLLLNLGTLAFMWANRPPSPEERGPFLFLVKTVGMDESQQANYRQLRGVHRSKMEEYRNQNSQLRSQLFKRLAQQDQDSVEVRQLIDSIANNRRQEEWTTYAHFQQVRAICRPDQQAKFDAVIGEAVQYMGPRGRQ